MSKKLVFVPALLAIAAAIMAVGASTTNAQAAPPQECGENATTVPGHCDKDGNVTGHYTSVYAYDASGDYYWDLGDGRVRGSVDSVDELDQETLTVCNYVVNYRGDFGDDPSLDSGWIMNIVKCRGHDDNSNYMWLFVSEEDPRYTGDGTPIWGTWEYHVNVMSKTGNLEAQ